MSKYELQEEALKHSGVSYEKSLKAAKLEPSIYSRIGESGFRKLSELFYVRVFADKEAPWFLNIFASSTKAEAVENQYRFFVQTFGGPMLYREKKGKYTRLAGRHANYPIGYKAAKRWSDHMRLAMQEHEELSKDSEALEALDLYFKYTASYIVAACAYMRDDQLSGGTKIDEGRIW